MKKITHDNAIRTLSLQRNYAALAAVGLLLVCMVQGVALLVKDTKVIGIPPHMDDTFWVGMVVIGEK